MIVASRRAENAHSLSSAAVHLDVNQLIGAVRRGGGAALALIILIVKTRDEMHA